MTSKETGFLEDMTGDLARALRKSWSEPQDSRASSVAKNSPISTPNMVQYHNTSPGGGSLMSDESQLTATTSGSDSNTGMPSQDYRLIKRHYSLKDALNDEDLLQEEMPESFPPLMPAPVGMPMRRSSLQEVQRVRHLLNPRSSFSGIASEEPEVQQQSTISWVTILARSTPDCVKPILVLHRSLQAVGSRYGLCVIHDTAVDASSLRNYGIETVGFSRSQFPILYSRSMRADSKIMLFVSLAGRYDLVCYLSPTCVVLENIDHLLSDEEAAKEIDNDTCVLLTNNTEDPEIVIFRPLVDVEMCIREFFTVYGDDCENRSSKITRMQDLDVLRTLFDDAWFRLAPDAYCGIVPARGQPSIQEFHCKVADYRLQKPWDVNESSYGTLAKKWHELWAEVAQQKTL